MSDEVSIKCFDGHQLTFLMLNCSHRRSQKSCRFQKGYRILTIECYSGWHLQKDCRNFWNLPVTGNNIKEPPYPISAVIVVAGYPLQPIVRLGRRGLKKDDNSDYTKAFVDLAIPRRNRKRGSGDQNRTPSCPLTAESLSRHDFRKLTYEMLQRYPFEWALTHVDSTICDENLFLVPFQIVITIEHEDHDTKEVMSDVFHVHRFRNQQDLALIDNYARARSLQPFRAISPQFDAAGDIHGKESEVTIENEKDTDENKIIKLVNESISQVQIEGVEPNEVVNGNVGPMMSKISQLYDTTTNPNFDDVASFSPSSAPLPLHSGMSIMHDMLPSLDFETDETVDIELYLNQGQQDGCSSNRMQKVLDETCQPCSSRKPIPVQPQIHQTSPFSASDFHDILFTNWDQNPSINHLVVSSATLSINDPLSVNCQMPLLDLEPTQVQEIVGSEIFHLHEENMMSIDPSKPFEFESLGQINQSLEYQDMSCDNLKRKKSSY